MSLEEKMSFIHKKLLKVPKSEIHGSKIEWNNILVSEDKCSFIFTIQNYSLLNKKNGEFIESSKFSMENNKDIKWFLRLYPNGISKDYHGYISLFLNKSCDTTSAVTANYFFSIIDKNNKNVETRDSKIFEKSGWGLSKFIEVKELQKRKETLLPDDTLTIFCSVVAGIDTKLETNTLDTNKILDQDSQIIKKIKLDEENTQDIYEKIYKDDSYADVILMVDNKELKAHKGFLAAASPVFASILKKDVKIDSITVTDISYEVMRELLHFIYTKKIDNLHNIAQELIAAADKYGIQDLKMICEKSLCKNINIDNVLKLIVIADLNDLKMLTKLAIEFIIKNKEALKNNPDFELVLESHPHLYKLIFWSSFESPQI